jgi:flagellar hook-basal body complex protein FliE
MAGINGISTQALATELQNTLSTASSGSEESSVSFADVLKDSIENSESLNVDSNVDTLNLLSGSTDDLAGLMIGAQKSETALNLTVAIRNKAMDAYKEIMNMQV